MTRLHLPCRLLGLLLTTCSTTLARADARPPFEFRDGDRVAFIGNTFVEREQVYSYLETLLRSRHPDKNITFRNLGWSGDTVFGHARSYFDPPEKGFERLDKIVHELKPTVIFISYGMGESFDGEAGLPAFRQGFGRMLDMLKDLDARTVIIGPTRHEDLGPPLPDPSEHNRNLRLYADALKEIAATRGHRFIDLYELLGDGASRRGGTSSARRRFIDLYELLGDGAKADPPAPLTDNGIHLTPYGYWRAAGAIAEGLGVKPGGWVVSSKPGETFFKAVAATTPPGFQTIQLTGGFAFKGPMLLPVCPPPAGGTRKSLPGWERVLRVNGLKHGKYVLTANGERLASASNAEWALGLEITDDPAARLAEKARDLAIFKNLQYFNQWRPANETYIFGFRAHEQGKNAAEMPLFDEPIAKLEAEITKLVQPAEVTYELKPE